MIGRSGSEPSPAGGGGDVAAGGTGTGLPWPKYRSPADLVIATQRARIAELEGMLAAALELRPARITRTPAGGFVLDPSPASAPVVAIALRITRPEPEDRLDVHQYLSADLYRQAGWTLAYALDDACAQVERALGITRQAPRIPR